MESQNQPQNEQGNNTNGNGQQPAMNQLTKSEQPNIVDSTLKRINDMQAMGELQLPPNYSAPNALKAAWLILQDVKDLNKQPALAVCTRESIAYALLNMAVQGLNPMKRQCSFIVYGNKLTMQREYQGAIAIAKRVGLKEVTANAIFKGDVFKYEVDAESGRKKIIAHEQNFENLGGEVVGAYAIIEKVDGTKNVEVMSIAQIRQAWNQGGTKGQSPAHKNFPDQMACKTVIGRALKSIINSSDDAALFEDDAPLIDVTAANVNNQIEQKANKVEIGLDDDVHISEHEEVKEEAVRPTQPVNNNQPETTGPGF